jgi:CBS domain-containing membrane protein
MRGGFQNEDVDAALADFNETFDIEPDDLERLLRQVEMRALTRSQGRILCSDVMSKDVLRIEEHATPDAARSLLLDHGVRTLPVVDYSGRLVGSVGWRQLTTPGDRVADVMTEASTAKPRGLAFDLFARLTDGRTQSVVILDAHQRPLGLISQTDLLVALARSTLMPAANSE